MKSVYQQIMEFKKKYSGTIAWRIKEHSKVIEKHLNPNEVVNYAFACQKNDLSYEFFTTYAVVLTNERILVAQKRLLFGYLLISITPDMYNDLTVRSGLIWGKIYIDTVKEIVALSNISKSALPEIESQITQFMIEAKKEYGRDN